MEDEEEGNISHLEDNLDGDEIIVQGFRQTRDSTNWLHRGTALTTTDRMDIDELQLHVVDLETVFACITGVFAAVIVLAKTRHEQGLQSAYIRLRRIIDCLTLSTSWLACHIQLLYLDIEDRLYFVHRVHRFAAPRLGRIVDFADDNESNGCTGYKKNELELLLLHWRIPDNLRCDGHTFTGEEAMLIYLHYIRAATPFTRSAQDMFGGDPRRFTQCIRSINSHLYNTFCHKISGDSMRQWLPHINEFRAATHDKPLDGIVEERRADGTVIDYEVYIPLETFRIFGWIDDTDLQTARPREARVVDANGQVVARDTQRAFYNRYFRHHGLKAQVVHPPNGMIGSIFICSVRHNDNGVQNLSGLNEHLIQILQPLHSRDGMNAFPALYGDGIFTPLATIMRPYQSPNHEQRIVNTRFSSLREDIEHKFSQTFGLYTVLRAFWRHQLFLNGAEVRMLFFNCLFISNCYTCFNESRNQVYNVRAPTVQQYLPLDEALTPAPAVEVNPQHVVME